MDSAFMNAIAVGVGSADFRVARFEFPYMRARRVEGRRKPPDREPVLRASWLEAISEAAGKNGASSVVIGGKSMGGRIASMVADEAGVAGLVCLGYPFHPPGQPKKLRVAHLEHLKTPALILQGERDAFGTREEVASYQLSKAIRILILADGDHSFKPRVSSGRTEEQNLSEAIAHVTGFLGSLRSS
jgi:predicted alpha/beta-hydrolase family hydrolase